MNGDDIRMVFEGSHELRFTLEPFDKRPILCKGLRQDFEGNEAVQCCIAGAEDFALTPGANPIADFILAGTIYHKLEISHRPQDVDQSGFSTAALKRGRLRNA